MPEPLLRQRQQAEDRGWAAEEYLHSTVAEIVPTRSMVQRPGASGG